MVSSDVSLMKIVSPPGFSGKSLTKEVDSLADQIVPAAAVDLDGAAAVLVLGVVEAGHQSGNPNRLRA